MTDFAVFKEDVIVLENKYIKSFGVEGLDQMNLDVSKAEDVFMASRSKHCCKVAINGKNVIFTAFTSGDVYAWPVDEDCVEFSCFQNVEITALECYKNGVALGSADGRVAIWNYENLEFKILYEKDDVVSCLYVKDDLIFAGYESGDILQIRNETSTEILEKRHSASISQLVFAKEVLYSASYDGTVRFGNVTLKAHDMATGLWTNGDIIITGGSDSLLKVWKDEKCVHQLKMEGSIDKLAVVGDLVLCICQAGCLNGIHFM